MNSPLSMDVFALKLLHAIGAGLSENDKIWLSSHLTGLPAYLESPQGRRVVACVVDCYKNSIEPMND